MSRARVLKFTASGPVRAFLGVIRTSGKDSASPPEYAGDIAFKANRSFVFEDPPPLRPALPFHVARESGEYSSAEDLLDLLQPGDILIGYSIDRLTRGGELDLEALIAKASERGIYLAVVTLGDDASFAQRGPGLWQYLFFLNLEGAARHPDNKVTIVADAGALSTKEILKQAKKEAEAAKKDRVVVGKKEGPNPVNARRLIAFAPLDGKDAALSAADGRREGEKQCTQKQEALFDAVTAAIEAAKAAKQEKAGGGGRKRGRGGDGGGGSSRKKKAAAAAASAEAEAEAPEEVEEGEPAWWPALRRQLQGSSRGQSRVEAETEVAVRVAAQQAIARAVEAERLAGAAGAGGGAAVEGGARALKKPKVAAVQQQLEKTTGKAAPAAAPKKKKKAAAPKKK